MSTTSRCVVFLVVFGALAGALFANDGYDGSHLTLREEDPGIDTSGYSLSDIDIDSAFDLDLDSDSDRPTAPERDRPTAQKRSSRSTHSAPPPIAPTYDPRIDIPQSNFDMLRKKEAHRKHSDRLLNRRQRALNRDDPRAINRAYEDIERYNNEQAEALQKWHLQDRRVHPPVSIGEEPVRWEIQTPEIIAERKKRIERYRLEEEQRRRQLYLRERDRQKKTHNLHINDPNGSTYQDFPDVDG